MNTDQIQHYIFDLYGTLVDIHTDEEKPELWEALSRRFSSYGAHCDAQTLRRRYFDEILKQKEALRILMPMAQHTEVRLESVFWKLFLGCSVQPTEEMIRETAWDFRRQSTEHLRLYPGAKELLMMLRRQGKVWLLSNAQTVFTLPELDRLGISSCFDGIYISSEELTKKPDPLFFRTLLTGESIRPWETVMIGNDEECDIRGAKGVGLHTVYLRSNLSPENDEPDADIVLDPIDLEKLAEILQKE